MKELAEAQPQHKAENLSPPEIKDLRHNFGPPPLPKSYTEPTICGVGTTKREPEPLSKSPQPRLIKDPGEAKAKLACSSRIQKYLAEYARLDDEWLIIQLHFKEKLRLAQANRAKLLSGYQTECDLLDRKWDLLLEDLEKGRESEKVLCTERLQHQKKYDLTSQKIREEFANLDEVGI